MKKGYKFWLRHIAFAILTGCAIWFISSVISIAATYGYINDPVLAENATLARMFMGISLAVTSILWYMTILLTKCHKQDEKLSGEAEKKHLEQIKLRGARAANFGEMLDDNRGKTHFTIYGENIDASKNAGPLCTLFRMLAILATMFTLSICLVVIYMMLSVIK